MVKQQRLDQDLEKVDEVIVAADVGDLVGQNGFELFDRQSGDGRGGQQNYRTKPTDDGGRIRNRRNQNPERAGKAGSFCN